MNPATLLDQQGIDTYLAMLLLRRGDLDQPTLETALKAVRALKPEGVTLARSLLRQNLIERPALETAFVQLVEQETQPARHSQPAVREQRIGDYRLVKRLGAGGMGVVQLAEHVETGGRYALKTLHGVQDAEAILRFQREALGHARADTHPNVVRIHSFGQLKGMLYLVMDLVSGGSLEQRLRSETLSANEAARISREVARGLAHIHGCGVLHRDVKPDNVLLDGAVPMLTDFGLAKVVGEVSLTVSGAVMGTPAYMAPEQIDSKYGDVGPWTDVYGLGAVLYRCLTGRAPFGGRNLLKVMFASLAGDPPAPRSLRKEIPAALEAICLRAMHKDPAQRFRSAAELAEALDGFLQRGRSPGRDRARLLSAVAAAAGSTIAVVAWALLSSPGAPAPKAAVGAPAPESPTAPVSPASDTAKNKGHTLRPSSLPLPKRSLAQLMLPKEITRQSRAMALRRDGKLREAADLFRQLLRDPISGKLRRQPARRLGQLLRTGGRGVKQDLVEAAALLFEAALQGEHEAAVALGSSHLTPILLERLTATNMVSGDPPPMSSDNSLAAACLRIYREYKPQNQATGTIAQLLEQDGFPLPATLSEAYATVWERYVERFPDRARQLLSKAPPPLPIPGANVTERNLERYNHAQRGLSSMAPSRAVAVFDELLFNEGGQLRPKPARHLALHLCRGSGIAQDRARGADLLMEAALRGDEDAALFLCQALVPPHVGEAIDEVLPFSKKVSVGLTPNAEVAGACARLFATKQDIGPAVLKVLRTNRIVCPATDEAYRLLWKHYMARRLTRKRRRE